MTPLMAVAGVLAALLAGCGDTFRPPVSSISPVGPAAQPSRYALAVSDPGSGQPGLFTMVDFSGDTVLNTTAIGVAPKYLTLGLSGNEAFVLNQGGTISSFGVSSYLQANQVQTSTLFAGANATSIFSANSYTYITEPYTVGNAELAEAQGSPPSVKQELSVGNNPVFIAGNAGSARIYVISQGANQVTAVQTATNTISNVIPVGNGPVYGVETYDNNRAFILNKTDGTVSVINTNTNEPDATTPLIAVGAGPVWADTYYNGSLLVTANATGNSVSVVSVPLCSVVALPSNPNCIASNPTDAASFGTVLGTVPVGTDPVQVSILQDGTRAYVANYNPLSATGGSVSVVNLSTLTVGKTILFDGNTAAGHGPLCHPNFIATIAGTPTGKVYVTCPDSRYMTILETDTDSVVTMIDLQGLAVQMRVTATQ